MGTAWICFHLVVVCLLPGAASACFEDSIALNNLTELSKTLKRNLYGQHVAIDVIVTSVRDFVKTSDVPSQPLVLSFHGRSGVGKTLSTTLLAESLYELGMGSTLVHFKPSMSFSHRSKIEDYKVALQSWVTDILADAACDTNLFILDDVENIPGDVIDVLEPFFQKREDAGYKQPIFILLGSTGAASINKFTYDHLKSGSKRRDITDAALTEAVGSSLLNHAGGLWNSTLIKPRHISRFVWFLPLEREHVKSCSRSALQNKNYMITRVALEEIADELTYEPNDNPTF